MFRLYAKKAKGLAALVAIEKTVGREAFECVVGAQDPAVQNDYFTEIESFCSVKNIRFFKRGTCDELVNLPMIAVGWRWIIPNSKNLYVLHDSLLPKYRGFAPLISALINGEKSIGVSVLKASEEYDCGDILYQKSLKVKYPLKSSDAIEKITPLYAELSAQLAKGIVKKQIPKGRKQLNSKATYSLWRDNDDYWIDWSLDSKTIERFVNAVGYPYLGAATRVSGVNYRVTAASSQADAKIENRSPGKVIFLRDQRPVVVCGKGLLKIDALTDDSGAEISFPLPSFRLKFVGKDQ